jgi:amino acid transporter
VTHIFFVKARKAQGISDNAMPYTAPFGICGSYVALFFCCLIAVAKNFNVFTNFDYKNFITGYLGIPLYLAMILGYKYWHNTKRIRPEMADMYDGKAEIDREEEFLAQQAITQKNKKAGWFYRTFVGWLF